MTETIEVVECKYPERRGRPSTYNNHKCRCPDCTAAWAAYIREKGYVRRYQQRVRENKKLNKAAESEKVVFAGTAYMTPFNES